MNPLTQIANTQKISKQEIAAGYSDAQSWHARFKHSAYIFAGGLPFGLTDGDLLAVFSQYGEIVDVNLVRHKDSGKSRGFAFLAYEDQRSTNLAVDNLNGAKIGGRIVTVDHVDNYRKKIAEVEGREVSDEEEEEDQALQNEDAEAAQIAAAVSDGAQIVTQGDLRASANGAAGPQSLGKGGSGGGDEPWASKTSVYALLNADLPAVKRSREDEEEDPMAAWKKPKKAKKEKDKKKKKEKKGRKEQASPDSSEDKGQAGPVQGSRQTLQHHSRKPEHNSSRHGELSIARETRRPPDAARHHHTERRTREGPYPHQDSSRDRSPHRSGRDYKPHRSSYPQESRDHPRRRH